MLELPAVFASAEAGEGEGERERGGRLVAEVSALTLAEIDGGTVVVLNKVDRVGMTKAHYEALGVALEGKRWAGMDGPGRGFVEVSVTEGLGMDGLVERLKAVLKER